MNDDSPDAPSRERRRFLMLMGIACASTALTHPARALAEPAPARPATPPVNTAPPPATAATDAPKPPSNEALALAQLVRLRYPGALNEEQIKSLTEDLDSRLDSGRALRKLPFANGDEPDMTFHA